MTQLPTIATRVIAVAILWWSPVAVAAVLWVDQDSTGGICSDHRDRSDVSRSEPWCTLKQAANNVQPGDVVHIRGGEYTAIHTGNEHCWDSAVLQMVVSGTPEAPIIFMGETGESVVFSGSGGADYGVLVAGNQDFQPRHIEVSNIEIRDFDQLGVMIEGTGDVVLKNIEVTNCRWGAIGTQHSARVTIEDSRIHHNALEGWISAISLWTCQDGNILRRNAIWSNTDEDARETEGHGIILDYCEDWGGAIVEDNVIWDNEGWCVHVFHSSNVTVRNNTCVGNGLGRGNDTGELSVLGTNLDIAGNMAFPRTGRPPFDLQFGDESDRNTPFGFNIWWPGAESTPDDRPGRFISFANGIMSWFSSLGAGDEIVEGADSDLAIVMEEMRQPLAGLASRSAAGGADQMVVFHEKMSALRPRFRSAVEQNITAVLTSSPDSPSLSVVAAERVARGVANIARISIDGELVTVDAPFDRVVAELEKARMSTSPGRNPFGRKRIEDLAKSLSSMRIRARRSQPSP